MSIWRSWTVYVYESNYILHVDGIENTCLPAQQWCIFYKCSQKFSETYCCQSSTHKSQKLHTQNAKCLISPAKWITSAKLPSSRLGLSTIPCPCHILYFLLPNSKRSISQGGISSLGHGHGVYVPTCLLHCLENACGHHTDYPFGTRFLNSGIRFIKGEYKGRYTTVNCGGVTNQFWTWTAWKKMYIVPYFHKSGVGRGSGQCWKSQVWLLPCDQFPPCLSKDIDNDCLFYSISHTVYSWRIALYYSHILLQCWRSQ